MAKLATSSISVKVSIASCIKWKSRDHCREIDNVTNVDGKHGGHDGGIPSKFLHSIHQEPRALKAGREMNSPFTPYLGRSVSTHTLNRSS